MTLPADTIHSEDRIDSLIVEAVQNRPRTTFDEIFMYVATNYRFSNCEGFLFTVDKRFKSLKRRGAIRYDRSARKWFTAESRELANA